MAEHEATRLREALYNQYKKMTKLYAELEEEREASATAASEALSMILRLQREKAEEKMEACQYKRMAEEKMQHVEETMDILDEVMHQKKLEISFLKSQLLAYKHKLLGIGFDVPATGEGRTNAVDKCASVRRHASLPIIRKDKLYDEIDETERDGVVVDNSEGHGCRSTLASYSILHPVSSGETSLSGSWYSAMSHDNGVKSLLQSEDLGNLSDHNDQQGTSHPEFESKRDTVHSIPVHDIFEVPEHHEDHKPELNPPEAVDNITADRRLNIKVRKEAACTRCMSYTPRTDADPEIGGSVFTDFHQVKRRLNELENEKIVHLEESEKGEEQLKLLREIYEQLNMIESRMKEPKSKKSPQQDDSIITSIMEAVLSFSI